MQLAGHLDVGAFGHVSLVGNVILIRVQVGARPHGFTLREQQRQDHFTRTATLVSHLAVESFYRADESVFRVPLVGAEFPAHLFDAGEIVVLHPDR